METDLKLISFMRPYTISLSPTRSTEYERWASRKTGTLILQGSESDSEYGFTLDFENTLPLTIINKQTDQPLLEHIATLDVQVSELEIL